MPPYGFSESVLVPEEKYRLLDEMKCRIQLPAEQKWNRDINQIEIKAL